MHVQLVNTAHMYVRTVVGVTDSGVHTHVGMNQNYCSKLHAFALVFFADCSIEF